MTGFTDNLLLVFPALNTSVPLRKKILDIRGGPLHPLLGFCAGLRLIVALSPQCLVE